MTHLSVTQGDNFRELGGTQNLVISRQPQVGGGVKEVPAVAGGVGEILPGFPSHAEVCRSFQNPDAGPRGVGHLDEHVGHMELLCKG